jgi:hypothetical protein
MSSVKRDNLKTSVKRKKLSIVFNVMVGCHIIRVSVGISMNEDIVL